MKKLKLFLLITVAVSVACIGCCKYEDESPANSQLKTTDPSSTWSSNIVDNQFIAQDVNEGWIENFDAPFVLQNNWSLYGKPQPKWVSSDYGQQGLFDNNGPSPTKNYAVSNAIVGKGLGYSLESQVMVKILDNMGGCVCPGIAVSRDANPVMINGEIATGISMRLVYVGPNAIWYPAHLRGHTWLTMEYLTDREEIALTSSDYLPADQYANTWQTLKIVVTQSRCVKFYIGNSLVWAPLARLHPLMKSDKKVVLGYTSDGNPETCAGVAYHNWVKAVTIEPLAQ